MARKTLERYREIVDCHLIPALGAIPLGKLQAVHVQGYYAQALTSGRRDGKGGLSAQTARHHDRVLNVALKRARSLRLISSNPVDDVSRPRLTTAKSRFWSLTKAQLCSLPPVTPACSRSSS